MACNCRTCKGALTTPAERLRHQARDRREQSLNISGTTRRGAGLVTFANRRSSAVLSPAPPLQDSIPTSQGESSASAASSGLTLLDDLETRPISPPQSPLNQETLNQPYDAEVRGLEYLQEVLASGEIFEQICRDDWEEFEPDEDTDSSDDDDLPPVSMLSDRPSVSAPAPSSTPSASTTLQATEDPPVDPFQYPPSSAERLPTPADVHPNRIVYLVYLLVFWLHSQCHLPFRACNAVLVCIAIILHAAGTDLQPTMYTTLPSVMNTLGAEPSFCIAPVCPKCMRVYPPSSSSDSQCTVCSIPLFQTQSTPSQERRGQATRDKPKPFVQFPYKSLEEQLAAMLAVPGIEDIIEQSLDRIKTSVPGKYTNIFDGRVCQELPSKDGSRFFSPSDEEVAQGEPRIGVSLGIDWSVA